MNFIKCSCGHDTEIVFGVNPEVRAKRPCLDCLNKQTDEANKDLNKAASQTGLTDGEDGFYYNGNFCG